MIQTLVERAVVTVCHQQLHAGLRQDVVVWQPLGDLDIAWYDLVGRCIDLDIEIDIKTVLYKIYTRSILYLKNFTLALHIEQ